MAVPVVNRLPRYTLARPCTIAPFPMMLATTTTNHIAAMTGQYFFSTSNIAWISSGWAGKEIGGITTMKKNELINVAGNSVTATI